MAQPRQRLRRPYTSYADLRAAQLLERDIQTRLPLHLSRTFAEYIAARTRFFDDRVLDAIRSGPCQIVILGAGYDDRALRFRGDGIHWVEVDHPKTQADKVARIRRLNVPIDHVTFIAVDFTSDDLAQSLKSTLSSKLPTLFLCEGLIPYLPPGTVDALLQQSASCPGSFRHLAAELPIRPSTRRGRLVIRMLGLATATTGERIRTVFTTSEAAKLALDSSGWQIERWQLGKELGMPTATRDLAYVVASS